MSIKDIKNIIKKFKKYNYRQISAVYCGTECKLKDFAMTNYFLL